MNHVWALIHGFGAHGWKVHLAFKTLWDELRGYVWPADLSLSFLQQQATFFKKMDVLQKKVSFLFPKSNLVQEVCPPLGNSISQSCLFSFQFDICPVTGWIAQRFRHLAVESEGWEFDSSLCLFDMAWTWLSTGSPPSLQVWGFNSPWGLLDKG